MTDELKTLKDLFINKDGKEWYEDTNDRENIIDELKQEAIKLVEKLEKSFKDIFKELPKQQKYIWRSLEELNEKLRITLLSNVGYFDNQRKQIAYFMDLGLSNEQIAMLLLKDIKYISKERVVINRSKLKK